MACGCRLLLLSTIVILAEWCKAFPASRFIGTPNNQNYVRSQFPRMPSEDKYYNNWKKWANSEEITQWQRSAVPYGGQMEDTKRFSMQIPLNDLRTLYGSYDLVQAAEKKAAIVQPIYQSQFPLQAYIQQPSYPSVMTFIPNMAFQKADQRGDIIQPEIRQQLSLPPPNIPYDPTVLGIPQNPTQSCQGCNGDCSNYLCYGCGGCPADGTQKPHYMYPYQKQDSGYHDAFESHAMDLSGLIISPVPPLPKRMQPKGKPRPGKSNTPEDDDDNDDDNDDDEDENESESDSDDNDNDDDDTVDDESAADNVTENQTTNNSSSSKLKKMKKTNKSKQRNKKNNR